jgi:heme oxygenase
VELTRLRQATEIQHRRVEQDLDLLRPAFTRHDYAALLRRFYGFHQSWEPVVASRLEPELPGFFAPRRKLQYLEADLRYLGCETEDLLRIRACPELPPLDSLGSVLGSLYVIEGSSLGGRILTRHFAGHLGVGPDAGCRFFSGYGERTGLMWSAFGELAASRPPAENDDMLNGAISTFELLGEWLVNKVHA